MLIVLPPLQGSQMSRISLEVNISGDSPTIVPEVVCHRVNGSIDKEVHLPFSRTIYFILRICPCFTRLVPSRVLYDII